MAYDSEGFFMSVLISCVICTVLLLLAKKFHHSDTLGPLVLWRAFRSQWPDQRPTAFNFGGWGVERSRFMEAFVGGRDPWFDQVQGAEARLYLTFLRLAGCAYAVIGLVAPIILIPTYVTDGYVEEFYFKEIYPDECCDSDGVVKSDLLSYTSGLQDWTIRNVTPDSGRMWVVVVVGGLAVYEVSAMVTKFVAALRQAKAAAVTCTAVVQVPGAETVADIRKVVASKIDGDMRKNVVAVGVPRIPPEDMAECMEDLAEARAGLERVYAIMEAEKIPDEEMLTHEELQVKDKKCCGSKVNGVEHFRAKHDELTEKLCGFKKEMEADDVKVAGVAYVTFKNATACAEFVTTQLVRPSGAMGMVFGQAGAMLGLDGKPVWFAPIVPENILWNNLGKGSAIRFVGKIVTVVALLGLAIFWGAIIAFLGNLENLGISIEDLDPTLKGLITSYLPVIVAAVLLALLPVIVRTLVEKVEKVPDKVEREVKVCRYLTVFSIGTTLILQAIVQGGGDSVDVLGDMNLTKLLKLFADILSPTNGYFVVLVMSAGLVGAPTRLNLFGEFIGGSIKNKLAKTKTEAAEAFYRKPFTFSEEYPRVVLIFAFASLLSISLPYLGIFAAIYFYLKYVTDRAILVDAYPRCRDSTYDVVPVVIYSVMYLNLMFAYLGIFLLSLIKERFGPMVAGLGIAIGATYHTYVMHKALVHLFSEEFLTGQSHPLKVLPGVMGKLTGYEESYIDDTVFKAAVGVEEEEGGEELAELAVAEADAAAELDKQRDNLPKTVSAYENPGTLLKMPEKLDHEAMRAEKWFYEPSNEPVANIKLVAPDVFFENRKLDTLSKLRGELTLASDPFKKGAAGDVMV